MERGEREWSVCVERGESGEGLMTDPTFQARREEREREWSGECVWRERERESLPPERGERVERV